MKWEKIIREYDKPDAYKYGLKLSSPFTDEFKLVVKKGAEVVEVKPGVSEILENDLGKHRLLAVHVHEGASFEYIEEARGEKSALPAATPGSAAQASKSDIHIFLLGPGAKAKI